MKKREKRKEKREKRKERREKRKEKMEISSLLSPLSSLFSPLSSLFSLLSLLSLFSFLFSSLSCAKTYTTAKPVTLQSYKQTYSANPNQIYYALRWALKAYGYPIAEEDLQNGVLKSRVVPVKATSHYIDVFGHKDFGVNGAYHQIEVKLVPKEGKTEIQIASRVQATVKRLKSTGQEEELILQKVGDYLRDVNVRITNLGIQE